MTTNERVKYLRKEILHMNQTDFANSIGMKQTSVSSFEKNGATVSDQTLRAISSIHRICEKWLRTGEGPMYDAPETFSLDKFARERGATDLELRVVKAYFNLDPRIRDLIVEHFKAEFIDDGDNGHPKTPEELESQYEVEEDSGLGAG